MLMLPAGRKGRDEGILFRVTAVAQSYLADMLRQRQVEQRLLYAVTGDIQRNILQIKLTGFILYREGKAQRQGLNAVRSGMSCQSLQPEGMECSG